MTTAPLPLPWPAEKAACFGTCCAIHKHCERWIAVDNNRNEEQVFIDHCGAGLPMFIDVRRPKE